MTGLVREEMQEPARRGLRCNDHNSEGAKAMSHYDEAPEEAEADLQRASRALIEVERDLAVAEAQAEEIEQ